MRRLRVPPLLMMDGITEISGDRGEFGKGHVVAEFDVTPDLWFFGCRLPGNPVVPGCLGLDGLWQLTGMMRPDRKLLIYHVSFTKATQSRRLTMRVANGIVEADGDVIYQVTDMKMALSEA